MPRTVRIAALQMDVAPAPTPDRLARAERLVVLAAESGAQLVVLPEVFNTGYAYTDANHRLAEPLHGPTATWMSETAVHLGIHLAGSLMLLDCDQVYNALLLYAPDGRMWRYDKNYPWGWERGYFRNGDRITVAETDLGHLGMVICWDTGHPELWKRYAGQVDLMVIASSPPDLGHATIDHPGGESISFADLGPRVGSLDTTASLIFGDTIRQQAAWLGVPAVNASPSGHFRSPIPHGLITLLGFLPLAPHMVRYIPTASRARISSDMTPGTQVVDARGEVLAALTPGDGESFVVAEVSLAEHRPAPGGPQPIPPIPRLMYWVSDTLLPFISTPTYRRGLRRAWGRHMAPVPASTRRWTILLGLGVAAGLALCVLLLRRKRKSG